MDCSVLSEIVAISKQNIYKTEYFQRKGYTQKILDKHCLGYLENGLRNYQKYITEDCSILSCYKYVIPNYDRNGNITYIIFRSDKKAVKDTLAFDIDSTYAIGNYNGLIWNEKIETWKKLKIQSKACQSCRILPLCGGGCHQINLELLGTDSCQMGYSETKKDEINKLMGT